MGPKKMVLLVCCLLFFTLFLSVCFGKGLFLSLLSKKRVERYYSLLEGRNSNLEPKTVSTGEEVKVRVQSWEGRSQGGEYALRDVRFVPDDDTYAPWKGKEKPPDWGDEVSGEWRDIKLTTEFVIPDESCLEGKTIEGDLTMEITRPVCAGRQSVGPLVVNTFKNETSRVSEPLTVHVFGPEEKRFLERGRAWIFYMWLGAIALSWTLMNLFFSGFVGLTDYSDVQDVSAEQAVAFTLVPCAIVLGVCAFAASGFFLFRLEALHDLHGFSGALVALPIVLLMGIVSMAVGVAAWLLLALVVEKGFGPPAFQAAKSFWGTGKAKNEA